MTRRTFSDNEEPTGAHDRLRAAGLRSTPQRQAILAAFEGGPVEHLAADEIYARAAASLPGLSRGTVYATLAEFTDAGLLAAVGTPEPVRYETNVDRHGHFRCRPCLRIFDVHVPMPEIKGFLAQGYDVARVDVRAEGICGDCQAYGAALDAGVREIELAGASQAVYNRPAATIEFDSPLGPLLLAATADGLARLAFAEHGDVAALRERVGAPAPTEAVTHLAVARQQLESYFNGEPRTPVCPIDWQAMDSVSPAFHAPFEVPYGGLRSYHLLAPATEVRAFGAAMGANPLPIFIPCHRVNLGATPPHHFVGGPERRSWLIERERPAAGSALGPARATRA